MGDRGMPGAGAAKPPAWVPNDSSKSCGTCGAAFGLVTRRHHCRACGGLRCKQCTLTQMVIEGYSSPQRVCDPCVEQLREPQAAAAPAAAPPELPTPSLLESKGDQAVAAYIRRLNDASRRFREEFPSYAFCQWAAPMLSNGTEVGVQFPEEGLAAMGLLAAVGDCAKDAPAVLKTMRKAYAEEAYAQVKKAGESNADWINGPVAAPARVEERERERDAERERPRYRPDKLSSYIRGVYQETTVMKFDLSTAPPGVTRGKFVGTMVLNTKDNEDLKKSLLSASLTAIYRNEQRRDVPPDVVIGRHGRVDTETKTRMLAAMVHDAVKDRAPSPSSGKKRVRFCSMLNALSIQKNELKYFKLQLQWLAGELSPEKDHVSTPMMPPSPHPQVGGGAESEELHDFHDDSMYMEDASQDDPELFEKLKRAAGCFEDPFDGDGLFVRQATEPAAATGQLQLMLPTVSPPVAPAAGPPGNGSSGSLSSVPIALPVGRPRAMATSPHVGEQMSTVYASSPPSPRGEQTRMRMASQASMRSTGSSFYHLHQETNMRDSRNTLPAGGGGAAAGSGGSATTASGTPLLEGTLAKAMQHMLGESDRSIGATMRKESRRASRAAPPRSDAVSSASTSAPGSPMSPGASAKFSDSSSPYGFFPTEMRELTVDYSFLNYVANWPLSLRMGANQHDTKHNSTHRLGLRQHLRWLLEDVLHELQDLDPPVEIPPAVLSLKGVRAALDVLIVNLEPADTAGPAADEHEMASRQASVVRTEDDPDEKDGGDKPWETPTTHVLSMSEETAANASQTALPGARGCRDEALGAGERVARKRKRCCELFMALRLLEELMAGKGSNFRRRAGEFLQLCLVEHVLNVTPFFNCKSGIDRTGVVCSLWASVQQLLLSPSRPCPLWLLYYLSMNYPLVLKTVKGVHQCAEPASDGQRGIPRVQLNDCTFADPSTLLPFKAGGSDDPHELQLYAKVDDLHMLLSQRAQDAGVETCAYALLKTLFFHEAYAVLPVLQTAFLCNLLGTSAKIAAYSTGVHGFKYGESGLPGNHNALCAQYLPSVCLFPNNKSIELTTVRRALAGTEITLSKDFQHYLVAAASARGT